MQEWKKYSEVENVENADNEEASWKVAWSIVVMFRASFNLTWVIARSIFSTEQKEWKTLWLSAKYTAILSTTKN